MAKKIWIQKRMILAIMIVFGLLTGCSESSSVDIQSAMVAQRPLIVYDSLTGEVEEMAYKIGSLTGGECAALDMVQVYPEDDDKRAEKMKEELEQNLLPELKPVSENLDSYDTVYVGSFLWNGELPPAVRAFLVQYPLSGKTVIPFGAAGQINGETVERLEQTVQELCPDADVRSGLLMQSGEMGEQDAIVEWLSENGQVIPIKIQAGETELRGILFSNLTSREFADRLPLEAPIYEPADFAKAFNLQEPLQEPGSRTRLFELGGLAYWPEGPAVAIFFSDHVDRTVVPVYTLGKVLDGAGMLEEYEGSITITLAEKFANTMKQ